MGSLSQDVAALERAQAAGKLDGRDLEVIQKQVERAEKKLADESRASAFSARRVFLPNPV